MQAECRRDEIGGSEPDGGEAFHEVRQAAAAHRARVRRADRRRNPRPRPLDADGPEEAARRRAARSRRAVRPDRPAGGGCRLRQRPISARQRRLAARPRPPRRRRAAGRHPLRHAPRQPARPDEHPLRRRGRPDAGRTSPARTARRPRSTAIIPSRITTRPRCICGSSRRRFWRWSTAPSSPAACSSCRPTTRATGGTSARSSPVFFEFHERIGRWPDAPKGRTRREIIALRRGLPVFRGSGTARRDLSAAEALRLAEALPPPVFDADRRLRELDAMEEVGVAGVSRLVRRQVGETVRPADLRRPLAVVTMMACPIGFSRCRYTTARWTPPRPNCG